MNQEREIERGAAGFWVLKNILVLSSERQEKQKGINNTNSVLQIEGEKAPTEHFNEFQPLLQLLLPTATVTK